MKAVKRLAKLMRAAYRVNLPLILIASPGTRKSQYAIVITDKQQTKGCKMLTVKVGRPLRKLIRAAYLANQPVLIIGRHGIGKSQIFEAVAKELGIGCEVFDLSIMESVDLAGLPIVIAGAMTYAPPKRLPSSGKGVIVFEELNRVAPDLQATCLQLCTARRFNDYILPSGYVPVAAINPPDEDYDTKEIDPALISRFLKVHTIADPVEWISWARDS